MLTYLKSGKFKAFVFLVAGFIISHASYEQKTDGFTIYTADKDSLIGKQLSTIVMEAQEKYDLFFGHRLDNPVQIFLASSEREYSETIPENIPDWSSGVAFVQKNIIILKPGIYYDPVKYRETLLHEIAHIYIHEIVGRNRLPVWLNEGICMYLSGRSLSWNESITVGNAISAGNIIDLHKIESVLMFFNTQAQLAYIESFLAVQYLVAEHGEKILVDICKDIPNAETVDDLFERNLGYGYAEFEYHWYQNLKTRFRWMSLLQFENILWLILVLFIVFAFIIRIRRNRKIYKKWEQEDLI